MSLVWCIKSYKETMGYKVHNSLKLKYCSPIRKVRLEVLSIKNKMEHGLESWLSSCRDRSLVPSIHTAVHNTLFWPLLALDTHVVDRYACKDHFMLLRNVSSKRDWSLGWAFQLGVRNSGGGDEEVTVLDRADSSRGDRCGWGDATEASLCISHLRTGVSLILFIVQCG